MRRRLERDIYSLVFLEDGGLISASDPVPPFEDAERTGSDLYQFAAKVAERCFQSLHDPTDKVVAAMAAVVVADGDISEEWQAGVEAAGKR